MMPEVKLTIHFLNQTGKNVGRGLEG